MRSKWILSLILLAFAILSWPTAEAGMRQKGKIKERSAGVIPNHWGDLVAVSGDFTKHALTFRNERGEIRIITLVGATLPDQAIVIHREYQSDPKRKSGAPGGGPKKVEDPGAR